MLHSQKIVSVGNKMLFTKNIVDTVDRNPEVFDVVDKTVSSVAKEQIKPVDPGLRHRFLCVQIRATHCGLSVLAVCG